MKRIFFYMFTLFFCTTLAVACSTPIEQEKTQADGTVPADGVNTHSDAGAQEPAGEEKSPDTTQTPDGSVSESSPSEETSSPEPASPEQSAGSEEKRKAFLETFITAQCELFHNKCCNAVEKSSPNFQKRAGKNVAECVAAVKKNRAVDYDTKRTTFVESKAPACLEFLKKNECGSFSIENFENFFDVCERVFAGKILQGGSCTGKECVKGTQCKKSTPEKGVCLKVSKEGEACGSSPRVSCDAKLHCEQATKKCVKNKKVGEKCTGKPFDECGTVAYCTAGICTKVTPPSKSTCPVILLAP